MTEHTEIAETVVEKIPVDVAKETANAVMARLSTCIEDWRPAAGKAREKLWNVLAAIYVAHDPLIAFPPAREGLIGMVKNMLDFSKGEMVPHERPVLELLVAYAVGFDPDTKSSRSQYAATVGTALSDKGLERTEEAFLGWLKDKGGIVKAIAKPKKDKPELEGMEVSFRFELFKQHMTTMKRRGAMKVKIDPEADVHDGFTVLFASFDPEAPGQVSLIETVGDMGVIKSVARAVANQRAKNLSTKEKAERARDQQLWTLNRVALKLGGRLNGPVTWEDANRWIQAYHSLQGSDSTAKQLFDGFVGVKFGDPTGLDGLSLKVANPDYHELDPGRYIGTARKGALAPFDLEALGTPAGDKALEQYIMAHTDPYIYAKPVEIDDVETDSSPLPEAAEPATFKVEARQKNETRQAAESDA